VSEYSRCENCGDRAGASPLFPRSGVRACSGCGAWFVDVAHFPAGAEALYGERYFEGGEYASYASSTAAHRLNFRRKLALLRRCGMRELREVRLLELGSATGEFLRVARELGVSRAVGLEVSSYAREAARARGLDVRAPDQPETLAAVEALRPNVIVGWDVWEHLPRPATTWDALLALAERAAIVALTTVDASSVVARVRRDRWRQFHPPTHLNFPTRRSLASYFGRRGFDVRLHRAFGHYRPLREYARAVGVRPGPARLWNVPVYLNLFDTQLFIARRAA
jgi:hypothetical protein